MTEQEGASVTEEPAPNNESTRGKVAIWLTYKGDRRWSLSVDVGTSQAEVDEAVRIALDAERALEARR